MQRCIADSDNTNNKLIVPKGNLKKISFLGKTSQSQKTLLTTFLEAWSWSERTEVINGSFSHNNCKKDEKNIFTVE